MCRLLYSRISQSRGRLVSGVFPDGIWDYYDGLSWRPATSLDQAEAEKAIHTKVTSMIKDGSFTAPADRPTAYYQNPWFERILKLGYWQLALSKGMSEAHTEHFGGGISNPLMALVVTATEKMLATVAAGTSSANANKKSTAAVVAFSHTHYAPRFHSHLLTLTKLHRSPAGPMLTQFLTQLHKELRALFIISVPSSRTLQLAIPVSTFNNYGVEQPPAPIVGTVSAPEASTARRPTLRTRSASTLDLGAILNDTSLTATQKLKLLSIIYETTNNNSSQTHCARATQQYEGRLANVSADSDDSEVEACRARALPGTSSTGKLGVKIWMSDSDEDAIEEEGGDGTEAEAEGDGNGADNESEGKVEVAGDSEDEDEGNSEVEIVVKEDPEAKGSRGAAGTTGNEEDDNKEHDGGMGELDDDFAPATSGNTGPPIEASGVLWRFGPPIPISRDLQRSVETPNTRGVS